MDFQNRIWFIGDIQYSNLHDWSEELNKKITDYLVNFDYGEKNCTEIIQLGDVVERAFNYGNVTKWVYKLFSELCKKSAHVYIVLGNHDQKFLNGKSEVFIDFLEEFDNLTIIRKEQEITTNLGFNFLALPYYHHENSLDKYYSNDLPGQFYSNKYDFIVGHVAKKSKLEYMGGVDFSKFNTRDLVLGHIHCRTEESADYYTGSIAPLKINEDTGLPRILKKYEKERGFIDVNIPRMVEYKQSNYGENLEDDPSVITIHDIQDAPSIKEAKFFYKGAYINNIRYQKKGLTFTDTDKKNFIDKKIAFIQMIKENKLTVKRKTFEYIKSLM